MSDGWRRGVNLLSQHDIMAQHHTINQYLRTNKRTKITCASEYSYDSVLMYIQHGVSVVDGIIDGLMD